MPSKAESVAAKGAEGAGGGKKSAPPMARFVGLKTPETIWLVLRLLVAASSKVSVTLFTGLGEADELPVSDMMMTRCPVGLTSRMSMSPGKVCERLLNVSVTLLTVPAMPETLIVDG